MQYEIVFDAIDAGYRNWRVPAFGLIFVFVGCALIPFRHQLKRPWFPFIFTGFALLWVSVAFVVTFSDYWEVSQALRTGRFVIVEGTVTDFEPMPREGHAMESFVVTRHRYEYSDYVITAGFNNTQSHGGPIQNGLRVRITDVRGKIARLEIAK